MNWVLSVATVQVCTLDSQWFGTIDVLNNGVKMVMWARVGTAVDLNDSIQICSSLTLSGS